MPTDAAMLPSSLYYKASEMLYYVTKNINNAAAENWAVENDVQSMIFSNPNAVNDVASQFKYNFSLYSVDIYSDLLNFMRKASMVPSDFEPSIESRSFPELTYMNTDSNLMNSDIQFACRKFNRLVDLVKDICSTWREDGKVHVVACVSATHLVLEITNELKPSIELVAEWYSEQNKALRASANALTAAALACTAPRSSSGSAAGARNTARAAAGARNTSGAAAGARSLSDPVAAPRYTTGSYADYLTSRTKQHAGGRRAAALTLELINDRDEIQRAFAGPRAGMAPLYSPAGSGKRVGSDNRYPSPEFDGGEREAKRCRGPPLSPSGSFVPESSPDGAVPVESDSEESVEL